MIEPGDIDNIAKGGIGAVGLAVLAVLVRFVYRTFRMEIPETKKDQATAQLFENLRLELERMAADLLDMKEHIKKLEHEINILNYRHREAQSLAVEAYAIVQGKCSQRCGDFTDITDLLKKIIGN
jgi:Tfp pilus assembly protein PilE